MLPVPSEGITFVIGGGPSLKGFDFNKLDGYKIGANKAAIEAQCDCLVSMDSAYETRLRSEVEAFPGEVILAHVRPEGVSNRIPGAIYVKSVRNAGLSNDPSVVYGHNSGYAALNVAYLKGAKRIALLGFDMKMGDTKHFHSGYSWSKGAGNYKSWTRFFDHAAKILSAKGVEVINYIGPEGSALTQFPTRPLEELQ